ncbi:hypothetical protein DPMN_003247 [Dreissena polymorpha]|uniref:Uncharacterized protein n=1 Tax=Dreissena polymorpha TaxID=45954 RepID=A0A9D4RUJ8_DREPO|nr:hypothetical protein DPMN_003247 [Dreissena polymorpha]
MAPDTKVPDGRTDGQRQNNIPSPLAGDNKHVTFSFYPLSHWALKSWKVGANRPTDQLQINRQGKNNMSPTTIPKISLEQNNVLTKINCRPATGIIFEIIQDIININEWTKHVTLRVFTSFYQNNYKEKCSTPWPPCFSTNRNDFKLDQDIISTNILTYHVLQANGTIFKLVQYMIIWTNLLFKFSDDRQINVTSRVLTRTIFKLVQDIIRKNLLTKFNGDQAINVASSVLTMQMFRPHDTQHTT